MSNNARWLPFHFVGSRSPPKVTDCLQRQHSDTRLRTGNRSQAFGGIGQDGTCDSAAYTTQQHLKYRRYDP